MRVSPPSRALRVCLFTDTLGDINGVSRFIQSAAQCASSTGRDLRVMTSTRFKVPERDNILNYGPIFAGKMPRYENLELVAPPLRAMMRAVRELGPDVIHISTPGPVGMIGRMAARRLRVPLLGVYHTDFPAYIDHLFDDDAMTWICAAAMKRFYKPFARVFTRSDDYARSLVNLGIARERITRLLPGIDTDTFHTRFRDPRVWERLGVPRHGVKVVYCGRISVEKNLPLLTRVWKQAGRGDAQLIVVGDGPYRARMERELAGRNAHFLGFRGGVELSTIYASADLFVFPSTTDTLGQVVMESQASGLPVLVSDQGGPKEVVRHGETGMVLPAADPGAWVRALVALVDDEPRRRRWGAAAHEFVRPMSIRHSFEHFWSVHEEVWREAANPGYATS